MSSRGTPDTRTVIMAIANRQYSALSMRTVGAAIVAVVLLVSGCGEVGAPTRGIALVVPVSGRPFLSVHACSAVKRLSLGPGSDMAAAPTVKVQFDHPVPEVRLDFSGPTGIRFAQGSTGELERLEPPFFVVASGTKGQILLATEFDHLPRPGTALTVTTNPYGSNSEVSLDQLPPTPDC